MLQLYAYLDDNDKTKGHALGYSRYPPGHPRYEEILRHVGPIKPGEEKPVRPWPETSDKRLLIDKLNKTVALVNHEIEQKNWRQANLHIKNSLDALGYRYANPNVIDDSSMSIIIADDFEKNGFLEKSARLRLKTLQRRLDLFKTNP